MAHPLVSDLSEWLALATVRGVGFEAMLTHVCEEMCRAGLPLARVHVSVTTLHPSFSGHGYTWVPRGEAERESYGHEGVDSPAWRSSPFNHMMIQGLDFMRVRLDRPQPGADFPIFARFRAQGLTDWLALRQNFDWAAPRTPYGQLGMIASFATKLPDGFDDEDDVLLRRVMVPLAAAAKSHIVQDLSRNVLAAYLGADAAARVLSGEVTRGHVSLIPAVILLADLRGFTALGNSHATGEVIRLLNRAFDAVASPIMESGGQILKFMGDAILAVFLTAGRPPETVAALALHAARAIQDRVPPPFAIDVVVHLGDVHYGNIGASDRLDFTVIGPAVNEASRMEGLCAVLGQPILLSAAVAALLPEGERVSVGHHALRGFDTPREIFAPV